MDLIFTHMPGEMYLIFTHMPGEMYLTFTHMPGESNRRPLRSLFLCLCYKIWLTPLCADSYLKEDLQGGGVACQSTATPLCGEGVGLGKHVWMSLYVTAGEIIILMQHWYDDDDD